jgi:hypothetical protein
LFDEHLNATEADIRSGRAAFKLGPATTFYAQLQVVLRRPPTPPSPIPIPRSIRPTTRTFVFPPIPESHDPSSSDSSYQPSPPMTRNPPDTNARPRSSTDSVRSDISLSSTDEDKLEIVANQAAITLLGLLCTFQNMIEPNLQRRLTLRLVFS